MNCLQRVIDVLHIAGCSTYVASSRLTRDSSLKTLQGEPDFLSCPPAAIFAIFANRHIWWLDTAEHGWGGVPSVIKAM